MPALRAASLALATTLALAAAHATTVKTGKPAASQPAAVAASWASRDQLRDCLSTEAGLKERFRAIEASDAVHEKMFDQVEGENVRLEKLQAELDRDSETSIKAFNALVKEHNQHVKDLNADAAASRPVADAYNADMVAFNHKCSHLRYRVDDMEAVMAERRKAAAAASAPL
ncbi:MAG TPA: hypothetical protein VIP05_19200 [Burkholderiaceae bacterium]